MATHPPQDNARKRIFPPRERLRALPRGLVSDPGVAGLVSGSREKGGTRHVSDDLRSRENDLVWRVRLRGQWLYVYLLLEFQSTDDHWMALRVMVYTGLLYQDLIRIRVVSGRKPLPPVFPIVLYSGHGAWRAPGDVTELIAPLPAGLQAYRPSQRYFLFEEVRTVHEADATGAALPDNLVATLARIEAAEDLRQLPDLVRKLVEQIPAERRDTLGQAFTAWLNQVVADRLDLDDNFQAFRNLQEVGMSEMRGSWALRLRREGREEGREEGRVELLERQLVRRFGAPLPDWVRPRLQAAGIAQLDAWAEAIFDAPSLEALFGSA